MVQEPLAKRWLAVSFRLDAHQRPVHAPIKPKCADSLQKKEVSRKPHHTHLLMVIMTGKLEIPSQRPEEQNLSDYLPLAVSCTSNDVPRSARC